MYACFVLYEALHTVLFFLYHRMNLCTTVTESDVARAKNALKASLVGQLNGNKHKLTYAQCKTF